MKKIHLYRLRSTAQGTFGIMAYEGLYWHSLELPDRNNKPNISCIPVGEYLVSLRHSPHFKKDLYHVKHVTGRTFILIHGANLAGDTSKGWQTHLQGCITLGKSVGRTKNNKNNLQRCVFRSRQAIRELTELTDKEDFILIIKNIRRLG